MIFHIVSCLAGLFGKLHFLKTLKLSIEVVTLSWVILNMPEARQYVGLELKIAISKEPNDGTTLDFFDVFLFEKNGYKRASFQCGGAAIYRQGCYR